MPVLHIIATGPTASGKSQLVRHFYNNLPKGYRLKKQSAMTEAYGQEYWVLTIEKIRERKTRNAQPK